MKRCFAYEEGWICRRKTETLSSEHIFWMFFFSTTRRCLEGRKVLCWKTNMMILNIFSFLSFEFLIKLWLCFFLVSKLEVWACKILHQLKAIEKTEIFFHCERNLSVLSSKNCQSVLFHQCMRICFCETVC